MSTSGLPFEPQHIDALQERYRRAVEPVYDQLAIVSGFVPAPSGDRQHVFDCCDGLRLIVSRERTPEGRLVTHLSASVAPDLVLWKSIKAGRFTFTHFLEHVTDTWQQISTRRVKPRLIGLSGDAPVPHFYVEETN